MDSIRGIGLTGDGKVLITSSLERRVLQWDVTTGSLTRRRIHQDQGITALTLLNGGNTVVTGDMTGRVQVWDATREGRPLLELAGISGPVHALVGVQEGLLIGGGESGHLTVWAFPPGVAVP